MNNLFALCSSVSLLFSAILYGVNKEWRFAMASAIVLALWSIRISVKEKGLEVK